MATHRALLRGVTALCAIAAAVLWSIAVEHAQERGTQAAVQPTRVQVEMVQVKPDMVAAYRELIKNDRLAAMKKAIRWVAPWAPTGSPRSTPS